MTEPHAAYAEIRADYDRLIARRDELILAGVDPAELLIPTPPPPPPGPRSWSLPPEPPEDVTAVVDRFGQRFERGTAHNDDGTVDQVWVGTLFAGTDGWEEVPDLHLAWDTLMRNHSPLIEAGPLTEVVDSE